MVPCVTVRMRPMVVFEPLCTKWQCLSTHEVTVKIHSTVCLKGKNLMQILKFVENLQVLRGAC